MVRISLIIPVIDEAKNLRHILPLIRSRCTTDSVAEILVVDGGSSDNSIQVAMEHGARVIPSEQGRAKQMNAGARVASGEILYFLHADTLPPEGFDRAILMARPSGSKTVNRGRNAAEIEQELVAGCFRLKFDWNHPGLTFFSWWTRINHSICRGGDQSLFVPKKWFTNLGGFNEDYRVYEDNEFIRRLCAKYPFRILKSSVVTSARKYRELGFWSLQYHFARIHLLYYSGGNAEALYSYYRKNIALKIARGKNSLHEINPSS